jgi:hypothetical protein
MQLLVFYLIVGFIVYYVLYRIIDIAIYSKYVEIVGEKPFYYYDFSKLLGVIILIITLGIYSNRGYKPMTVELTSGEVVKDSFRINVYNNYETPNGKEYFKGAIKTIANDKYISMFKDTDILLDDIFNNIDTTQKIHTEKKK